jgi:hypothetical protein
MAENIFAALYVLFLVALFAFICASPWINEWKCERRWEGTYETNYRVFQGCKVKVNGKWIPESNVREF